jgi:hypothetical protein
VYECRSAVNASSTACVGLHGFDRRQLLASSAQARWPTMPDGWLLLWPRGLTGSVVRSCHGLCSLTVQQPAVAGADTLEEAARPPPRRTRRWCRPRLRSRPSLPASSPLDRLWSAASSSDMTASPAAEPAHKRLTAQIRRPGHRPTSLGASSRRLDRRLAYPRPRAASPSDSRSRARPPFFHTPSFAFPPSNRDDRAGAAAAHVE